MRKEKRSCLVWWERERKIYTHAYIMTLSPLYGHGPKSSLAIVLAVLLSLED